MSEKIVVPALGESVTEATVSKWLNSVGENVASDEPIVELETDLCLYLIWVYVQKKLPMEQSLVVH